MYSILLEEQPEGPLDEIAVDLAEVLGVKKNTALQIVSHTPLIVFSNLSQENARILLYALNEAVPVLHWQLRDTVDDEWPAVNWNKLPTINGKTLDEIAELNKQINASAQITCPHCLKAISLNIQSHTTAPAAAMPATPPKKAEIPKPNIPSAPAKSKIQPGMIADEKPKDNSITPSDTDSTIIKTADSVILKLSEDLEKSFGFQEFNPSSTTEHDLKSNKKPAQNKNKSITRLSPGLYQLFLPPLRQKKQKTLASDLCTELLGWSESETKDALKKRFVCVAKDIDHVDGSKMLDVFEERGLKLTSKKIASL